MLPGAGGLAEVLSVAVPSTEQVLSDHSFPYFFLAQVSRLTIPSREAGGEVDVCQEGVLGTSPSLHH